MDPSRINSSRALLARIRGEFVNFKDLEKLEQDAPVSANRLGSDPKVQKLVKIVEKDDLKSLKSLIGVDIQLNEPLGAIKWTLLHMAASFSSCQILSFLINRPSVAVNQPDSEGNTPLMVAITTAASDAMAFYSALLIILNNGVTVEMKNNVGNFPLLQAVHQGFKNTTKLLISQRFHSNYAAEDLVLVLKAAAYWNQDEVGMILVASGAISSDLLSKFSGVEDLIGQFARLSVQDENENVSFDAAENRLTVGCIVQTLSKEILRRHFPAVTKDSDIAVLADQRAIVHSIAGDRLYLEFLEGNHMAVVMSASVTLVELGPTVKLSDGSSVTVGRFVRVCGSKQDLEELHGTRWRHGMERTCGKTGRLVRTGKEGLVQVQFSVGSRYYFDPKALTCSTEDQVEGCDGAGNWFRKGSAVRVSVPATTFVDLQKEVSFPNSQDYVQLVGKLVHVDKITIKSFSMQKILRVIYKGTKFNLNGQAISVVDSASDHSGAEIHFGDTVTLIEDKQLLRNLQTEAFGGWVSEMAEETEEGMVTRFYVNATADLSEPLVGVTFGSRSFFLNPKSLRVKNKVRGNTRAVAGTAGGKLELIKRSQLKCTDKLGEGGFGAVYKGIWDLGNGKLKTVAIKQMNYGVTTSNTYDDVIKEAKIQYALKHPNIVSLYGVSYGPQEDLWLVMRLVPGMDLQSILFPPSGRRTFDLPFKFKVKISLDMSYAIAFIHSQGYVHQDIKPSNMMVDQRTGTLYVCDFGVTRYLGNMDITTFATRFTQNFGGTLLYVAPECLRQNEDGCHVRPTFKSDVWSLGATFYEIFAERHLFDDGMRCFQCKLQNDSETVQKLVQANVPREVRTIIRRTLDFVPHRRPNAHQLTDFFHAL